MRSVVVYVKGCEAGLLARFKDGSYEFRYTGSYRRKPDAEAVSFRLPLSQAVHRSKVLFPYFYGLLAEGVQKRLQCRYMHIDERDHFTRLAETCRQGVIGAVYVLPMEDVKRRRREMR